MAGHQMIHAEGAATDAQTRVEHLQDADALPTPEAAEAEATTLTTKTAITTRECG